MELHLQQMFSPFAQNRSGKRRIWGIITGEFGYARGNWAPSGGLRWQVGTTQATGWGGGQPGKSEPFSDGRDARWRLETCLAAAGYRDHFKGMELLISAPNLQLHLGLGARCPGYPGGSCSRWSPCPSCGMKRGLPAVLQFNSATAAPSGGSVPAPGACSGQKGVPGRPSCLSAGRKSTGAGPSSSQAAEAAGRSQMTGLQTGAVLLFCLCFQARKPVHLLFQPFQWWTDMSNDSHTLVQLPCCFAGTTLGVPCSIWGVFNTRESAYQLHMYQTGPLTTKNL